METSKKIDDTVYKIIENKAFVFCNKELIYCISKIQNNGFTKAIYSHADLPDYEFEILQCFHIEDIYKKFVSLYEELLKYSIYDKKVAYRELNDEEMKEYIPILCVQRGRFFLDTCPNFWVHFT